MLPRCSLLQLSFHVVTHIGRFTITSLDHICLGTRMKDLEEAESLTSDWIFIPRTAV